ncbi:hypothetical protein SAMN04487857_1207 [Pseudomonas sp. ok272]|nr:hypothetical protein SAMN04487857_1207 [Pseudomonas sp. ok272]SFN32635.1 hypothetical protein SAMN04487858_1207 [Pseudomonas sp. ok602]
MAAGCWLLAVTGFATSIDALVVGVGQAVGLATMSMVTIGAVIGQRAEIAGGVVLIMVGSAMLYEHLSAVA